jgi:hypothetical protein
MSAATVSVPTKVYYRGSKMPTRGHTFDHGSMSARQVEMTQIARIVAMTSY